MEPPPQIVILAIGAAEEGAEAVELDPLEHRRRAAGADRGRVRRRDAVDLDGIEFVEPLALQQRKGGNVVKRIAEIGEQHRAPVVLGQAAERGGDQYIGFGIDADQIAPFGDRVDPLRRAGVGGHVEPLEPLVALAFEIEAERGVDRAAHRLARRIGRIALCLDRGVEFAREEAQTPDAKAKVVGAEKGNRVGARARTALARNAVEPAAADFVPHGVAPVALMDVALGRCQPVDQRDQLLDHRRELEVAIGRIGEAGARRRLGLRLCAPAVEPRRGRGVEEEGRAEQRRHLLLDLDLHRIDDALHAADAPRHILDRLDAVADRLFARNFGQCAEDGRKKARRAPRFALACLARLAEADRSIIRLGIDIDEAPVDLAPRRPLLERRDRRTERRVGEHRPVDEHPVGRIGLASGRELDADEIGARQPGDTALFEHAVEFAQREGRKGAGKAGGRARRGGEAGDVVEPLARAAVLPEMHNQPVFLLGHARRTVERERHAVPRIVGHRDE